MRGGGSLGQEVGILETSKWGAGRIFQINSILRLCYGAPEYSVVRGRRRRPRGLPGGGTAKPTKALGVALTKNFTF